LLCGCKNHIGPFGRDKPISSDNATSDPQGGPDFIDLESPTRRGDVIAAVLCLAAGLIGYFVLVPMAVYVPAKFAGTANSPAFLPNVLFILLAALSALYLVQSLIVLLREASEGRVRQSDWALAGGTALICIGYVFGIHVVGMTLGSALAVAATIFYFGERRPVLIASIAVILPLLLWYFFVKIAHILLPTPWLRIMNWLEALAPAAMWMA
jgi:putative tricarboxylic transport membrane protein